LIGLLRSVPCTFSLLQHRLDKPRRIVPELAQQPIVLRILDRHRIEAVFRQPQQGRAQIGHQHRGVRRHHDLADAGAVYAAQELQELDLARRRQRGFRLVEDEDALAPAALLEETQKPSPCEWERKSGGGGPDGSSSAASSR
jgi:hypothetical protein